MKRRDLKLSKQMDDVLAKLRAAEAALLAVQPTVGSWSDARRAWLHPEMAMNWFGDTRREVALAAELLSQLALPVEAAVDEQLVDAFWPRRACSRARARRRFLVQADGGGWVAKYEPGDEPRASERYPLRAVREFERG